MREKYVTAFRVMVDITPPNLTTQNNLSIHIHIYTYLFMHICRYTNLEVDIYIRMLQGYCGSNLGFLK